VAPITLLDTVVQCETIEGCKHVFAFLQSRADKLLKGKLGLKSKMTFLRICNCLMRRLSKTNNTIFCGEILMLLAYVLPLDEPSGVNKNGKTNKDNVTIFEDLEKEADAAMGETGDEGEDGAETRPQLSAEQGKEKQVNHRFYGVLWSLQSYFSDAALLSAPEEFAALTKGLVLVLDAFETNKLTSHDAMSAQGSDHYFPKYLTSSKLMSLQMRDPAFRRHILLQCLILFQSLDTPTFCKKNSLTLNASQRETLKALRTRTLEQLQSTPVDADSAEFSATTEAAVSVNEKIWTKWKDEEKCPALVAKPVDLSKPLELPQKAAPVVRAKRSRTVDTSLAALMGEQTVQQINGHVSLGNAELGRLWALPPNLLVCEDSEREFAPNLQEYLQRLLDEEEVCACVSVCVRVCLCLYICASFVLELF
jgi:THO complex subunit 1